MSTIEQYDALDDFAGPGGWDEGARMIGLRLFGVNHDKAACQTAQTAGHARETADVTTHPSPDGPAAAVTGRPAPTIAATHARATGTEAQSAA